MNEPRRAAAGGRAARRIRPATIDLPRDADALAMTIGGKALRLTNLRKPFWPALGITKRDLLQYYAAVVARAAAASRGPRDGDEALSRTARTASSSS